MDTRMKFLEHELAEQEREMNIKHDTPSASDTAVKSENTDALERKVRELEAMVKGLTEEVLDLKSVTRKLSQQFEEVRGSTSRVHAEPRFAQKLETSDPVSQPIRSAPGREYRSGPAHSPAAAPRGRSISASDDDIPAPRAVLREKPVSQAPPVRAASRRPISAPAPEPVPEPEPDVPVEQLKPNEVEYVMQPDGTIQKRKRTNAQHVIIAGTGYNPSHASRSMAIRSDSDTVIEAAEDDTVMDDTKKRR